MKANVNCWLKRYCIEVFPVVNTSPGRTNYPDISTKCGYYDLNQKCLKNYFYERNMYVHHFFEVRIFLDILYFMFLENMFYLTIVVSFKYCPYFNSLYKFFLKTVSHKTILRLKIFSSQCLKKSKIGELF